AEDGIRDLIVTGVQTCALPICPHCWRQRQPSRLVRCAHLAKNPRLGAADRPHLHAYGVKFWEGTMSGSRKSFSRRTFLKAAAGVTAGTGLMGQPLAAQSIARPAAAGTHSRFPRIDPKLMITPQQAWDWHVFKSQS